jgi:hypothetical protein
MQLLLASARAATPEILTLRARYFIEKGRIIEKENSLFITFVLLDKTPA